jgi:D-alanyl-D-alanine carboxypeptidase
MKAVLSGRSRSFCSASRSVFYGLLALVAIGVSVTAQSGLPAAGAKAGGALAERLDTIAGAGVREDRSVGLTAAVVKGQDTLLLKAYGKADVEGDVPATVDTLFSIGSDTKQFTAAAILQLRDQGKLGLDDDITKWLPDFETRGNKVTLRHLLGHTSGVTDLVDMQELRALKLIRNPTVTRDDVYKVISRQAFMFPTGTMQLYSNSNFWLLGLIIEKASGMTYEDYVEKKIFEPLGMKRSMYCNGSDNVPRRAYGHGLRNGVKPFVRVMPIVHTGTYAAGAICSTAEDLIAWLQALHGGKVLTPKSYAEMMAPASLDDGTRLQYSMGLIVGQDSHGTGFIGHGGGGFGYSSQTRWYPDVRMAVVVLTNSEPDDTVAVADHLAAAVVPPPPVRPFTGDASPLVGTYKGPGRGREMVLEVSQTPQGIAVAIAGAPPRPLVWVAAWTFRQNQELLTFRRTAGDGPATELRFDRGGGHFILKRQ